MNKTHMVHVACSAAVLALLGQLAGCALQTDEQLGAAQQADSTGPLVAAQEFLSNVSDTPGVVDSPDTNAFGSPAYIDWVNYTGTTIGATFFTQCLLHSDSTLTGSILSGWWGSGSPSSNVYYSKIVTGNRFHYHASIASVAVGDLGSINYTDGGSGHSFIVETAPAALADNLAPLVTGTTQYSVGIIDSTSTAHGSTDSRWVAGVSGNTDPGAGRGTFRVYADSSTGAITGYAWSLSTSSTYYAVTGARPIAFGAFDRTKAP